MVEGSGFDSLAACATAISTLWGLKVEIDELREVVDRLVEDGFAERQGGGLVLSREAIAHQEQVAMESEAIEADVRRRKSAFDDLCQVLDKAPCMANATYKGVDAQVAGRDCFLSWKAICSAPSGRICVDAAKRRV